MKVINIEVTDQLKVTSIKDGDSVLNSSLPVKIASGNYKSVILNFDFKTNTWNETTLAKYATFNIDGQEKIQVGLEKIGDYEYACYLPYAVAKQNCKANIGVYGASIINGEVKKIVSSENLYFLIVDGSFSVFLSDETPPKIETIEEKIKTNIDNYTKQKTDDFNLNYQTKLNNINSNILNYEENEKYDKYANSKRLEQNISSYFAMTPDNKIYTVRFPLWETSNTCIGEKLDDNAGLVCTPATDTVKEVSDYGEAWQSIDCNAEVDSNGVRHITALKGMNEFSDTGRVDVFCLFRTYYQKIWEQDGYLYISRSFVPREGYDIVPQAINKDGTINQWFVIGKYVVGDILDTDGKTHHLYSSKGLIPAHAIGNPQGNEEISDLISYAGCVNLMHNKGVYYSAGIMADYMHILTTFYLKFATKNTQSIMYGLANNNFQYKIAKAENNVNRVIITKAQANNVDLHTFVSVGEVGSNTNLDRWNGYIHNIAHDVEVIGKEEIDSSYTALILDHAKFNTTTTMYVTSMHERSGYSDKILGRTGSIGSNTNGRHGMVLDGIELMVGGYEVAGNAILNIADATGKREIYYTNDSKKLTTNITNAMNTYSKSDLFIQPTKLNADNYITEMKFDTKNGLAVQTKCGETGSGATVGYADSIYFDNASSGQRELLLLGHLGSTMRAGLSRANMDNTVAHSRWVVLARLSINGVGGELAE